jgi:two-component system, NarL family, response regulator NreC
MPIRLLVVDDHTVIRAGLVSLLNAEPGLEVVGDTGEGHEVLRLVNQLHPDVVLLDINLGEVSGLEIARQLKTTASKTQVLILTIHEDSEMLQEAIRNGASGYLPKHVNKSGLVNAIYAVCRNEIYVHSSMVSHFIGEKNKSQTTGEYEPLTKREIQVLRLLVKGNTNAQVAELLHVSERTIEFHRKNILFKLNLSTRAELVEYAIEHGYLT